MDIHSNKWEIHDKVEKSTTTNRAIGTARTEPTPPLTDARIRALKPPERGQDDILDGQVAGLYLRISQGGKKTWLAVYRIKGDSRKVFHSFGSYPDLSLGKARDLARQYRSQAKLGIDPRPKQKPVSVLPTVDDLCADYLEYAAIHKRQSSLEDDKAMIENHIKPTLGILTVSEVTKFNIEALITDIGNPKKENHPYKANRVRALLSTIFNRAVQVHSWCAQNPVAGCVKFPEHKRKRYLSSDEAKRLLAVLADYPHKQTANAIAFLLFTGARCGEVFTATWDQFVDTGNKIEWTKPSAHTKQKQDHHVPLNACAIEVLNRIKADNDVGEVILFPGRSGNKPLVTIKKAWAKILDLAKIPDDPVYGKLRLHDLRHSFASILINNGVSLDIIGGLLGHTQLSTTQRYAHLDTKSLSEGTNKLALDFPVREITAK